jgi:hypothetical protein
MADNIGAFIFSFPPVQDARMQKPEAGEDADTRSAECLDWPMEGALRLALEIRECRHEIEEILCQIENGRFQEQAVRSDGRFARLIERVRECGTALDRIMGGKGHWRSWLYDWSERLSRSSFFRRD